MKYGAFINPSPKSLSDLINDNNYMSIREYILDATSLNGNSTIAISDLNAGSSIVRVSLNVKTPFISPNSVNTIEVVSDTNQILLSSAANDPAIANNYITECSYITSSNDSMQRVLYSPHELSKQLGDTPELQRDCPMPND